MEKRRREECTAVNKNREENEHKQMHLVSFLHENMCNVIVLSRKAALINNCTLRIRSFPAQACSISFLLLVPAELALLLLPFLHLGTSVRRGNPIYRIQDIQRSTLTLQIAPLHDISSFFGT